MWKAIETVVVIFLGLLGVAAAKETEEATTGQGATMMGRSQHKWVKVMQLRDFHHRETKVHSRHEMRHHQ